MDKEIISACRDLGKALKTLAAILETGATVEGKRARKTDEDPVEASGEQQEFDLSDDSADETLDDTLDEPIDEEDFTTPVKTEKKTATKSKKVTTAQVNDACKARAKAGGKKGRDQVLALLLKHFKTNSVSDIKPELYGKVLQVMQVTQ